MTKLVAAHQIRVGHPLAPQPPGERAGDAEIAELAATVRQSPLPRHEVAHYRPTGGESPAARPGMDGRRLRQERTHRIGGVVKRPTITLTPSFIERSRRGANLGDRLDRELEGRCMTYSPTPRKAAPSPWAVLLLIASTGFAALSIALFSSGFTPG